MQKCRTNTEQPKTLKNFEFIKRYLRPGNSYSEVGLVIFDIKLRQLLEFSIFVQLLVSSVPSKIVGKIAVF